MISAPRSVARRATLVAVAAATLLAGPVVLPTVAQATPVAPHVSRHSIGGVDPAALANAPQALEPASAAAAARGASGPVGRAPRSTTPAVLTAQITPGGFNAAGVAWKRSSGGVPVVQIRVREKGTWLDWQILQPEGGGDPGSPDERSAGDRVSTEPVVTAAGDAVQVRVDLPTGGAVPQRLELVTVDGGRSAADANPLATSGAAAHGAVAAPTIISRAQWGADESLRTCSPSYSPTIKAGFVHHTVNSNDYAPSDSPALVRAIYAFHVNGNGWCDIGYQFLVDRYGQVFEGRAGGIDRPVIGAQAGGFNLYTFAVSGIGDFTTATPPTAMTDSMSRVMGWKLSLHGADPQGRTTLISAGGPYTAYPAGTPVGVRVVSGHRDVDQTDCPGGALYPLVPSIAGAAATYIAQNEVRGRVPATLDAGGLPLRSPSGSYQLSMQVDGNLVVYSAGGQAVWSSGTNVPYSSYLAVQPDGNVVIYDGEDGFPLWTVGAYSPGARLVMQDDGNLVLYAASGAALWDSRGYLGRGVQRFVPKRAFTNLAPGASVRSHNSAVVLTMQADGNLVEYAADGSVRWATMTNIAGSRLTAQADGNVVMYAPDGRAVWNTFLYSPGAYIVIQDDGNVVEYSASGTALWDAAGFTGHQAVRRL